MTGSLQGDFMPVLFEVSTEVCNKVGGIYTVLRSKAPSTVDEFHERYYMIGLLQLALVYPLGPYNAKQAALEYEPHIPPEPLASILRAMKAEGIESHYGTWLVDGAPHVILFDCSTANKKIDEWKTALWNECGIGLPPGDKEADLSVLLGFLVPLSFQI